jgi:two-component system, LytTR family, response regulator
MNKLLKSISVKEIEYLEAKSNYTIIHLHSLDKVILPISLKETINQMPNEPIIRIHKSIAMTKDKIKFVNSKKQEIISLNGTILPISRRRKNDLKTILA